MKDKSTKIFLLFLFLTLVLSKNNFAQQPQDEFTYPESHFDYMNFLASNPDSLIQAIMDEFNVPGLAARIILNDEILWSGDYGYANLNDEKEITESTLFYVASIAKPFTATAIMQLWEKDLFELDDNINDYLPEDLVIKNPSYPDDNITFRMLLSHTSSLELCWRPDLHTFGSDFPMGLDSFLVNYLMPGGIYYEEPYLNFKPGNEYQYSNLDYTLLAYLVETIADTPFSDYCQTNIFKPLAMDETFWFLSDLDTNKLATPYFYDYGEYIEHGFAGIPYYPAGGLKTTADQLSNFLLTLLNKGIFEDTRILESATVDTMTTKHYPYLTDSGFGWWIDTFYQPATYWCQGGLPGWKAFTVFEPEGDLGFMVFTNGNSYDALWAILDDVLWPIFESSIPNDGSIVLKDFQLFQNYPNPFNPVTIINYELPITNYVNLSIYNVLGMKVITLVSEKQNAGHYQIEWNAHGFASGIYYYRLSTGTRFVQTKKCVIFK